MNKIVKTIFALDNTAKHEAFPCCDPYHEHTSPILHRYTMTYREHKVVVVQDSDQFDVRIDDDWRKERRGICWGEVEEFVEAMT